MSLERSLFSPIERLANTLYPYRWRLALFTLACSSFPLVLASAARLFWPEQAARLVVFVVPVLFTLVAWSWSAFLIAVWFGSRPSTRRFLPNFLPRPRSALAFLFRVWGLIVLAATLLMPFFMWAVILPGWYRR